MPTSLTPVESQVYEPLRIKIVKPKQITTVKMVEEALIKLYNIKGTTLKQIYKYLLDVFHLESISIRRARLVKKYLKSLREDIVNITGKGLTGHFKLIDKKNFSIQILKNQNKRVSKAMNKSKTTSRKSNTKTNNSNRIGNIANKYMEEKKTNTKFSISLKHNRPVILREVAPASVAQNSLFDTPQFDASTPLSIPPQVRKRVNRENLSQDDNETPRSSLPKKRRKLLYRQKKQQNKC